MKIFRTLYLLAVLAMAVPVAPAFADQALGLDGVNDLAREEGPFPSTLDVPTFTVEAWIFPSAPGRTMVIASDSAYRFNLCVGASDCLLGGSASISGIQLLLFRPGVPDPSIATAAQEPGGDNAINFGEWNHVAASYNNATKVCTLSVNGNVNTLLECLDGSPDTGFDQRFGIGVLDASNQAGTEPIVTDFAFAGQISAFRVSNSVRYTADFTPGCPTSDAATLGLWFFHEPVGATSFAATGAGPTLEGVNGGATVVAAAGIPCGGAGGQPTKGDFNASGTTDLLWRNSDTGTTAIWFMNGASVVGTVGLGVLSPAVWQVAAIADFNGDGHADILWRSSAGVTAMWLMNGGSVIGTAGLGVLDPAVWQVAAAADFNGDGRADILWRSSAGVTALWFMNGGSVIGTAGLGVLSPALWQVAAVGDLNGDGRADILWRSSTGTVAVWLLNGGSVIGTGGLGVLAPAVWQLAGVGDFNGDGRADILWRSSAGVTALWFMNGTTVIGTAGLGVLDPAVWQVAALGDLNGDGNTDIVWRSATGSTALWFMNGGSVVGSGGLGVIHPSWVIQDPS